MKNILKIIKIKAMKNLKKQANRETKKVAVGATSKGLSVL